jgi:hypothetical protein
MVHVPPVFTDDSGALPQDDQPFPLPGGWTGATRKVLFGGMSRIDTPAVSNPYHALALAMADRNQRFEWQQACEFGAQLFERHRADHEPPAAPY